MHPSYGTNNENDFVPGLNAIVAERLIQMAPANGSRAGASRVSGCTSQIVGGRLFVVRIRRHDFDRSNSVTIVGQPERQR